MGGIALLAGFLAVVLGSAGAPRQIRVVPAPAVGQASFVADAAIETGRAVRVATFAGELERAAFVAWTDAHRRPAGSPPDAWWDCIALHEQGGDWTAHSSTYSSGLGILNAAIRENAPTPEIAARILAGTATREEQIETADRIYVWAGPGAWSTSRSC